MNLDKVDVLRFKIKDEEWDRMDIDGVNEFIKIKDVQGDTKRVREYTNAQETYTVNFYTLYSMWKEEKIEILEGNLHELE